MDIGYLGSSYKLVQEILLSKNFNLKCVITEKKRLNKDIILICELYDITIYFIENYMDLINIFKKLNLNKFIIYNFGLIIKSNLIENNVFVNIHPGNLRTHRGRNPLFWSMLKNDKTLVLTAHEINEQIDCGKIIKELPIDITLKDSTYELSEKIEQSLSKLLEPIYVFLKDGIYSYYVEEGIYEPKVTEKDYTINIDEDSLTDIYNKIRSQNNYKGAIIYDYNKKIYVSEIVDIQLLESEDCRNNSFVEKKKDVYIIDKDKYRIYLLIRSQAEVVQ